MPEDRDLQHYLRTYRQWAGFSQAEMIFLVGGRRSMQVSRYERFVQNPDLSTAFAYGVIFHVPLPALFAGQYHTVEQTTLDRIHTLAQKLETAKPDRLTARKQQVLLAVLSESLDGSDLI